MSPVTRTYGVWEQFIQFIGMTYKLEIDRYIGLPIFFPDI